MAKQSSLEQRLNQISQNGKSLFLAYDHGIEHGPSDFNGKSVDPNYVMQIAVNAGFSGIVLQKGVAERYYNGGVPLILKLNGKTNLVKGDPISRQVCSVDYAYKLGAKAVGYTIYLGSSHESQMLAEFGRIVEEAHNLGLPAIAWIYPRGKAIKVDTAPDVVAYGARVGLELGADIVKVKYTGDVESFKWVVKSAGKTRVVAAGGSKAPTDEIFLRQVQEITEAGAAGLAVGRNVWQHRDPLAICRAISEIVFGYKVEIKKIKSA